MTRLNTLQQKNGMNTILITCFLFILLLTLLNRLLGISDMVTSYPKEKTSQTIVTSSENIASLLSGSYTGTVAINEPLALGVLDISFTLTNAPLPPFLIPTSLSIGRVAVTLMIGLVGEAIARQRNQQVPRWFDLLTGVLINAGIVAALIFGGIGLFVEAAAWALFIALALIIVGAIAGFTSRGRSRAA